MWIVGCLRTCVCELLLVVVVVDGRESCRGCRRGGKWEFMLMALHGYLDIMERSFLMKGLRALGDCYY